MEGFRSAARRSSLTEAALFCSIRRWVEAKKNPPELKADSAYISCFSFTGRSSYNILIIEGLCGLSNVWTNLFQIRTA